MTPDDHIDRAEQYVTRMPNAPLAGAHALIAIAKMLRADHAPARPSIAGDCGTVDQWAEFAHERRRLGVTQQTIADGLGCSVPYLSQLERGIRRDSRGWYALAMAVLDVEVA